MTASRVLRLAAACRLPRAAALAVLITFPFFAGYAFAGAQILALKNKDDSPLLTIPVKNGSSFAIRYIHSVAQTPVTDFFTVKDGAIWLDRTVYHDFGAGLPHQPEGGQQMSQKNGELIISGYNKRLPQFALRVGRVANHVLLLCKDSENVDEEIRLDTLAAPGSVINFAVEERPAGEHMNKADIE